MTPSMSNAPRQGRHLVPALVHRAAVCTAAAVLGVAAATAQTAPARAVVPAEAGAGAHVFRLSFSGYVLEAGWSTCPDPAAVPVGTVCRTTDVMAFLAADQELAPPDVNLRHPKGPTVKVFEGDCRVVDLDGERGCAPQRERFGRTEQADVSADPRLNGGGARADIPVQTWSSDGDSGEDLMTVSVDWVGTGERTVLDEGGRFTSRHVTTHEWTRGWQRGCTASATVDGAPVAGEAAWCSMLRVRQADFAVFRGR